MRQHNARKSGYSHPPTIQNQWPLLTLRVAPLATKRNAAATHAATLGQAPEIRATAVRVSIPNAIRMNAAGLGNPAAVKKRSGPAGAATFPKACGKRNSPVRIRRQVYPLRVLRKPRNPAVHRR